MARIDVRAVLSLVNVRTLVLHRRNDRVLPIETSRYLAARIPGARLVELDGVDHYPWAGDLDSWMDEVREFVTGGVNEPIPIDSWPRCCSPTWSTRLVGLPSSVMGDGERCSTITTPSSALVTDHGGTLVKTTGDGLLSWFDGPARAIRGGRPPRCAAREGRCVGPVSTRRDRAAR